MKLILIKEDGKKCEIELDPHNIDRVVHGQDNVKELSILKIWHTKYKPVLQPVMDQIESFGYADLSDIIFEYNPDLFVHYHVKIKTVCLRSLGYLNGGNPEIHEQLTFKFAEDMKVAVDTERDLILCNNSCQYLKDAFCTKFKKELLTNDVECLVCEPCFLHSYGDKLVQVYHDAFRKMQEKYFNHDNDVIN